MQLKFSEDWLVPVNLFILLIAVRGCGKTPSSKCFVQPILDLELEETNEYEASKREARKMRSGQGDEDDIDEQEQNGSTGKGAPYFNPKTRICESITNEALLETLKSNSASILIKTDEFKVSCYCF